MSDGISPLAEFVVGIGIIIIIIVIAIYMLWIRRMKAWEAQQSNVSPSTTLSAPTINCPYCGGPLHFGDKNVTTCEYCGREVQKLSDS